MRSTNYHETGMLAILSRGACAFALSIVLILTGVCDAQAQVPDTNSWDNPGSPYSSVVPARFELESQCAKCGNLASCEGCGCCGHCCRCGGLLHRWLQPWEGGLDIGLNGAEGNTRDTNFTIGFDAKGEFGLNTLSASLDYFFQRESSAVTKNRVYALGRYERAIPDSAWSWFTDTWFEYDQFEDWRSRIGLHLGASVLLRDTDCCTLKGRLGLGTSRKAEGPRDQTQTGSRRDCSERTSNGG